MKIKLVKTEAPHIHKFVVEFEGYWGDADIFEKREQVYEVDSIQESIIVGKLMEAFCCMSAERIDSRKYPSLVPFWEDEETYLYDVIPYNADQFDAYLHVTKYAIYYYDFSGNKFHVMPA